MRAASQALIDYLAQNNVAIRADLYTVTLVSGTVYRWTSYDADLVVGGQTFSHSGPVINRGRTRLTGALEVDTLDVDLQSGDGFAIGSLPLGGAAAAGVFDGAKVKLEHLIMPSPGDTSLGALHFFEGKVAGAEPYSTGVKLRVKSVLEELNIKLPRRTIQATCPYDLYSSACGVTKAPQTFTVVAGSTVDEVVVNGYAGADKWNLGFITFTSGGLVNVRRSIVDTVKDGTSNQRLKLAVSLPAVPAVGNTVSLLLGCDKSSATCRDIFNNANRYGGFPFTPASENIR